MLLHCGTKFYFWLRAELLIATHSSAEDDCNVPFSFDDFRF
jgi:hypothetical protein